MGNHAVRCTILYVIQLVRSSLYSVEDNYVHLRVGRHAGVGRDLEIMSNAF
jgi:hypothetical protein